jgi:hypothetical protein
VAYQTVLFKGLKQFGQIAPDLPGVFIGKSGGEKRADFAECAGHFEHAPDRRGHWIKAWIEPSLGAARKMSPPTARATAASLRFQ